MKIPNGIREFLLNGICVSTSLREAVQMVAVLEVVFAIGFMGHGSYLCFTELSSISYDHDSGMQIIFGGLYLICGITYGTLTWLLWITSENPTLTRCHIWLTTSVLILFAITALTVTRNALGPTLIWSANIWIICGILLQLYMISVVWAFMLNFQHKVVDRHDSSPQKTTRNVKASSVSCDDNIKKSTLVVAL